MHYGSSYGILILLYCNVHFPLLVNQIRLIKNSTSVYNVDLAVTTCYSVCESLSILQDFSHSTIHCTVIHNLMCQYRYFYCSRNATLRRKLVNIFVDAIHWMSTYGNHGRINNYITVMEKDVYLIIWIICGVRFITSFINFLSMHT